jgi:hypothetical protein
MNLFRVPLNIIVVVVLTRVRIPIIAGVDDRHRRGPVMKHSEW